MLLGAGALAGLGRMSFPVAMATAVGATLLADATWYSLGRLRGTWILETRALPAGSRGFDPPSEAAVLRPSEPMPHPRQASAGPEE